MAHVRREDNLDVLLKILAAFAAVPVILTLLCALVAGCYTVVWHIGNWVGWW